MTEKIDDLTNSGDAGSKEKKSESYVEGMIPKENFERAMKQRIAFKDENEILKSQLQQYEQAEMERKGEYEDLVKTLKNQLAEKDKDLKESKTKFFGTRIKDSFEAVAREKGCVDPEGLMKILGKDAFKDIGADENFNIKKEDLSMLVDKAKVDRFYMFKESSPIVDASPSRVDMRAFEEQPRSLEGLKGKEFESEVEKLLSEII